MSPLQDAHSVTGIQGEILPSRQPPSEPKVVDIPHNASGVRTSAAEKFREPDAEQYLRFSPARKVFMVAIISFCSFLAPISSTSILSAIPEVASTYNTTGSIINASNALYIAFMGIASPFWGPISQVWGRRPVSSNSSSTPSGSSSSRLAFHNSSR